MQRFCKRGCWNCGLVAFPSRPWIKKQGISRGEARKPQTELPHQRLLIYLIYISDVDLGQKRTWYPVRSSHYFIWHDARIPSMSFLQIRMAACMLQES